MLPTLSPKISVLVITYNHEMFISQAIESVLMQEVACEYEIVIGEDCSTDKTREIVIDLNKQFPDKIHVLLPEHNLGGHGTVNLAQTLRACRGQYIALLEGDDYWSSPWKLQKQVDYLDTHAECAICFHNATMICDAGNQAPVGYCSPDQKELSTLEDLLRGNFIPTCSTMFRRGLFKDFPEWYFTLKMGDWSLHIFNAQHGTIGYINEIMGVHRIHGGGSWSSKTMPQRLCEAIRFYDYINAYLGCEYDDLIKMQVAKYYLRLAWAYEDAGQQLEGKAAIMQSIAKWSPRSNITAEQFKALARLYCPGLYRLLEFMKAGFG